MKPVRVVWLNATGLTLRDATLGGQRARVIPGNADFVGITRDAELPVGPLAIDVAFDAPIDHEKSRGIYAEKEGSEVYAYTFFEAIDARRAFPCFDEPAFKIPWQLVLHVQKEHVALANAAVVRETDEPDGMKRVEMAESRPMPSYLVAFVVGPFEVVDGGVAGRAKTPIRFVVPKGRAAELGWAKHTTPPVVAALEDYFDMDYPFGKLDVAVVPRYWGTMEHPGLVAMGQPLTLIRPEQETRRRKEEYTDILAHELSHYWFGDYVTMAWWDDTWLNEALGQWSDMNITDAVEPGWHMLDERVPSALAAMAADETLSTGAIRRKVETREAIESSFDAEITYLKGSSVLRMFESFVGREPWRAFIRAWVRAHAWGNASADEFVAAMRVRFGAAVADGFQSFLDQPGLPRITVACTGGSLAIHQRRSLPAGVTDPAPKLWRVPVCVRYGDAKTAHQACVVLDGADGSIPVDACPAWIIPNADAVGYYRASVDPASATALLDPASPTAKVAKPSTAERMMLVADLNAMVRRDELPIDQVLALVPRIVGDADPRVAASAVTTANFKAGGLDDALYGASRRWLVSSLGPAARSLGWKRAPGDSDERHGLRLSLLQTVGGDDDVLGGQGETLADEWIATRKGLDDDAVDVALRVAAFRGNRARFDRFVAAAKGARDRDEQQRILRSLGSFKDRSSVEAAFALVLGHDFDLRDSADVISGLAAHRETRDVTLAWLDQHLDELLGKMRSDEASWFLAGIAGSACDPARRATIARLVTPRASRIDGAAAPVARALEQSDQCIAATERELPALRRFFAR